MGFVWGVSKTIQKWITIGLIVSIIWTIKAFHMWVSWQEPKDKWLPNSHTCLDMRVVDGWLLFLIGKVLIYSGVSDAKMPLQSLLPVLLPSICVTDWRIGDFHDSFFFLLNSKCCQVLDGHMIWIIVTPRICVFEWFHSYSYMSYRSFHSLHSCTKLTCGLDSPPFLSHPLSVYVLSVSFVCVCVCVCVWVYLGGL